MTEPSKIDRTEREDLERLAESLESSVGLLVGLIWPSDVTDRPAAHSRRGTLACSFYPFAPSTSACVMRIDRGQPLAAESHTQ